MKSVKDYNSYVKLIRAVVMVVVCFTVIYVVTLAGKSRINNYKSSEKSKQDDSSVIPEEDEEAYELPPRTLNTAVIPYDGKERTVSCWGDSMMFGIGAGEAYVFGEDNVLDISDWTTPYTLEYLTGIKVYNLGVAGETSNEIALRQGGIKMYADNTFEVGYDDSVEISIIDEYGNPVYMADFSAYGYVEPHESDVVYINDDMFKITGTEETGLYICRYLEEEDVYDAFTTVYEGTQIVTKAAHERKNDILILEIGSNGGWDNYRQLISQYDAMIQNAGCDYFIIVGDTDDPGTSIADTAQGFRNDDGTYVGVGDTAWEATLREAYGEHFINMRTYLIENGLSDVGLRATKADYRGFRRGRISKQLRSDWTHFNSYGYYAKGLAIYAKGVELGYWK